MSVCATCGVALVENARGRLFHADAIPKGVDPDHEAIAVAPEAFGSERERRWDLKAAAEDMLLHHGTLHPLAECPWAQALGAAARRSA